MGAPVERIHTATIPPGLAAGDPFLIREVRADGKTVAMSLTVPADKRGGETIRVRSQGPAPVALVAQHAPTAEHGPIAEDLDDDLDDDFGEQTQSDARAAAPAAASHDSAPLVNTTAPTRTRGDAPPMTAAPGFTSATPGPLGSGVPGPSAHRSSADRCRSGRCACCGIAARRRFRSTEAARAPGGIGGAGGEGGGGGEGHGGVPARHAAFDGFGTEECVCDFPGCGAGGGAAGGGGRSAYRGSGSAA